MDVPVLVHPAEILRNSAVTLIGIRQHKHILFLNKHTALVLSQLGNIKVQIMLSDYYILKPDIHITSFTSNDL